VFLLGAGVAGFAIGRLVRAGASADGNGHGTPATQSSRDWTGQSDRERAGAAYATGQEASWQTSR
jgi:hypothetical protein